MPFPKILQDRIDAAQKRLDAANTAYAANIARYNDWTQSIQSCYKDAFGPASDAATGAYTPQKAPCLAKGNCDLSNCKNVIQTLQDDIIPHLKAAYAEVGLAKSNYDLVYGQVLAQSKNDPQFLIDQHKIDSENAAKEKTIKYRWIFGITVVIVIAVVAVIWYKIRKP